MHYDAVLPVTVRDLEFLELLDRTATKYLEDLSTCWVVTPESELPRVRERLQDTRMRCVSESDVVPALARFPDVGGWSKQQLIKLAVAAQSQAPVCLPLDCDVLCVQRLRLGDLVRDGKVLNARAPRTGDEFLDWYRSSAKALGVAPSTFVHAVTPSPLVPAAVRALADHVRTHPLVGESTESKDATDWHEVLLRRLPWTEYALYFTYLEHVGAYETYHVRADRQLYGNCVWSAEDAATWDPAASFEGPRDFYFSVLQSCVVDVAVLREMVSPYL